MATTSAYQWADRVLGGKLGSILREKRDAGLSAELIAFELRSLDVEVSRETVRRWLLDMEAAA